MAETQHIDDTVAEFLRPRLKLERFYPESLKADTLRRLFPGSGLFVYRPDEYILYQGDETKDVYIVVWGTVSITQTTDTMGVTLASLGPGSIFGEMALVRDGARVASVIAAEEAGIFKLAYADVQAILRENPALGQHLKNLAAVRTSRE